MHKLEICEREHTPTHTCAHTHWYFRSSLISSIHLSIVVYFDQLLGAQSHPKPGRNTFFSSFQLFLFLLKVFRWISIWNQEKTGCVIGNVFICLYPALVTLCTLSIFQNSPSFSLQPFQCQGQSNLSLPGKVPAVTHILNLLAAPNMTSQWYIFA